MSFNQPAPSKDLRSVVAPVEASGRAKRSPGLGHGRFGSWLALFLMVLCGARGLLAQTYTWSTLAGKFGGSGYADGTGSAARFNIPIGVAVDTSGNVFVADYNNNVIRKITSAGVVSTFAGSAGSAGSTDGTGSAARFQSPSGVVVDASGNVFVADTSNHTIRKITSAGVVSTFAGSAGSSGSTDGTGSAARFNRPIGVAVDASGNVFVADASNNVIRKITSAGVVSTFAGSAGSFGSTNGIGSAARFKAPSGVAVDAAGNVYVADASNNVIRKITSAGVVSTFAGSAGSFGSTDGTGSAARFNRPVGVAVDASGNVFVADASNNVIRKITSAGVVSTFAGSAGSLGSTDGTGSAARFNNPIGVAVDASGNVFVADASNNVIRKITSAGVVSTFAGSAGSAGSTDGTGSAARFNRPFGVAVDASGNVFVAEASNNVIRKITSAGVVSTFAGSAGSAGSTDGTGSAARFNNPQGIAVDAAGNVFVADTVNHTIRKITSAGVASTFAGTAGSSGSTDGTGSAARFYNPSGVAVDAAGNVFVADSTNYTIRKITSAGVVSTFAGTAASTGSTDGTGSAARFNSPSGVAVDAAGNVFVADRGNGIIRKITSAGVVSTFAGSAGSSGSTDGTGSAARFNSPSGVAVDAAGNVFVADRGNGIIRKITSAGVVSTKGGSIGVRTTKDGAGYDSLFNDPTSIAVDSSQHLLVCDSAENVIRFGETSDVSPSISVQPSSMVVTSGSSASFSVTATGTAPLSYQWRKNSTAISGATSSILSIGSVASIDAGTYDVVVTNAAGSVTSNAATLIVNVPIAITGHPTGSSVNPGASKTFSVTATGTTPITYQWSKDGSPIAGASSSSLTLSGISSLDAGSYSVVVSNSISSATSNAAVLTVNAPVVFSIQPANVAVTSGSSATFSVSVTGTAPITYQWRKDGAAIAGATNASLTISNAQSASIGAYSVLVSNMVNSLSSNTATLTVNSPVVITTQPVSAVINPGSSATFSVSATGTAPMSYQWRKNLSAISGATSPVLTLSGVSTSDAAGYDVVVTNPANTVTSNLVSLSINSPVTIITHPVSTVLNPGGNVTLSVAVTGTSPFSYQWRKNGANIAGGTAATLAIINASSTSAANYDVVVGNVVGSVTSNVAVVSVNSPISITSQPVAASVSVGSQAIFSVTATGTAPLTYQWRKAGVPVVGATSASLTLSSVQESDAGSYDVVLTNPVGTLTSKAATLTINTPLAVVSAPSAVTVTVGTPATMSIVASGSGPFTYQWYKDGVLLAGATGASYRVAKTQASSAGSYYVKITNRAGTVTSGAAALTVNFPVTITSQPASAELPEGAPVTLSVGATGSGVLGYQWYKDGVALSGATGATYSIKALSSKSWGAYTVAVTNFLGTVTSARAQISIAGPPVVFANPVSQTFAAGMKVTLTAQVLCISSFSYQWMKDGVLLGAPVRLPGGKTPIPLFYTINNATLDAEGLYSVVAYNALGNVQSAPAIVQLDVAFLDARLLRAGRSYDLRKVVNNGIVDLRGNVPANDILQMGMRTSGVASCWWSWAPFAISKFSPIPGQTSESIDFSKTGLNTKPGQFMFTVKTAFSTRSMKFMVTSWASETGSVGGVVNPLTVLVPPRSITVSVGGVANFGVKLSGAASVYSWYEIADNGQRMLISSGDVPFLSLTNVAIPDAGRYFVIASDDFGNTVESDQAVLTVVPAGE